MSADLEAGPGSEPKVALCHLAHHGVQLDHLECHVITRHADHENNSCHCGIITPKKKKIKKIEGKSSYDNSIRTYRLPSLHLCSKASESVHLYLREGQVVVKEHGKRSAPQADHHGCHL